MFKRTRQSHPRLRFLQNFVIKWSEPHFIHVKSELRSAITCCHNIYRLICTWFYEALCSKYISPPTLKNVAPNVPAVTKTRVTQVLTMIQQCNLELTFSSNYCLQLLDAHYCPVLKNSLWPHVHGRHLQLYPMLAVTCRYTQLRNSAVLQTKAMRHAA